VGEVDWDSEIESEEVGGVDASPFGYLYSRLQKDRRRFISGKAGRSDEC
jgi:hypothetical protein